MRTEIVRGLAAWIALSVVGVAVVALPDDGRPVVSLSETHGPAVLDLAGVALLLLGWILYLRALWRARHAVTVPLAPTAVALALGAGIVAWSVGTDSGMWWMAGVGILTAVQLWVGLSAAGVRRRRM